MDMYNYDIILGMDWLAAYHASVEQKQEDRRKW